MTVQNIKGTLAKLLATENLIVEHKKCETAQFNVETRVLTLPIWDNISDDVYDLLVGHEVGHALYTPNEDFSNIKAPKSYLNVTEDARIEKLMKRKFPGLNKSFYRGYNQLMERDFFMLEDVDVDSLPLVDRINLYFKGNFDIQFTIEEDFLVKATAAAETFADAILAAEEIYRFSKEQQEREQKKEDQDVENVQEEGSSNSGSSDSQEESDGETEETEESQSYGGTAGGEKISDEIGGGEEYDIEDSITDKNLQESLKDQARSWGGDFYYYEVPKVNLDTVIAPNEEVWDVAFNYFNEFPQMMEGYTSDYNAFKKSAQKEVNYLVKEFECKKSADAYARAATSRTGVLNTGLLHTYKFNEDLFKKVTVLPDGKNHGLIFVLDWSGSMGHVMKDTIKQLLNLVWFCRKVKIPFEVYAFTYEWFRQDDTGTMYLNDYNETPHQTPKSGDLMVHRSFNLLNLLTSKTNARNFERQCLGLYILGIGVHPHRLGLSGTPLNEAIICLHEIIPQFKKEYGIQKVHVSILTDGEANYIPAFRWVDHPEKEGYWGALHVREDSFIRNRKNGHTYKVTNRYTSFTKGLLDHLSGCFPEVNLIGFRLVGSGEFGRFLNNYNPEQYEEKYSEFRKEKSVALDNTGYVKYFALNANSLNNDVEFNVEEGAKKSTIRSAFKKSLANKKLNKKVLSQFVELVA